MEVIEKIELPPHIVANGPEGLAQVLAELLEECLQDVDFASREHYVLYQLGSQQSLLKIDMSKQPYQFWYYDLLGRPATRAVKETIARFLWEKCGEKEAFLSRLDEEKPNG